MSVDPLTTTSDRNHTYVITADELTSRQVK